MANQLDVIPRPVPRSAPATPATTQTPAPNRPGSAQGPSPSKKPSELSILGIITVLSGVFLSMVDFFIVNVALPSIDHDLHASSAILELIIAGYGIAYALLLVIGGRLGDTFGRRRLFITGMAAFGVTSLLCGLAPSSVTLVAARVLQGASAALMVPQVLATIQATTTGPHRARAISMYGAAGGLAAVVGQILGGVLISADIGGLGWRPIFLVNVPIVAAGLLCAVRMIPETRATTPPKLDVPGTVLLGLTVLTLLIPLTEGRATGWPLWAWLMLTISPVSAAAFMAVEHHLERTGGLPLVPPSLLKMPSMRNGLLASVPFFVGFGGFMFVYAVVLQQGIHLSALQAGLALTPMGVAFLITSLNSPRWVTSHGRRVIWVGALIQAVGLGSIVLAVFTQWPHLTPLNLAVGMTIAGAGQGLIMSPLFRVVLSKVPTEQAGIGSGVLITTQQVALALGVATVGGLFLSLSEARSVGAQYAFITVLCVQILIAGVVMVASRRLPRSVRG